MLRWKWRTAVACLGLLALGLVGCGSSSSQPQAASGQQGQAAGTDSAPAKAAPKQDPKLVVEQFLQATKQGDKQTVRRLLTRKAVEEMEKHDRSIDPQGSPSAQFKVMESELVEGGAHVLVHWIDGPEGQQKTTKMIWVLKPEQSQWRVAGVIIKLFEDLPPVPFDFEDPADMEAKSQFVENEMRRRAEQAEQQAASAKGKQAAEQSTTPQTAGATTPGKQTR